MTLRKRRLPVLSPRLTIMMGSLDSDITAIIAKMPALAAVLSHEQPQHRVRITKPFYLGKYPVTQEQWEAVMGMGNNPGGFKGPKNPVENVSWDDCQQFLDKLNKRQGNPAGKFVLPTEAKWEYACRAGSKTRYCFGDDDSKLGDYAWYLANADGKTHPVGKKKPNAWGLYDMHGNVFEWCADWFEHGYYKESPVADPMGAAAGSYRVDCGGCWRNPAGGCRSAMRDYYEPWFRYDFLGLRVSLVPADPSRTKDGAANDQSGNTSAAKLADSVPPATVQPGTTEGDAKNPKSARDYYERGLQRQESKQFEEARADFKKAGDLDPLSFDAQFTLSSLCAHMKDYRAAIEALTASLKARPKDYSALFNRGLYFEYLDKYDDAIANYTQALAKDADFSHNIGSANKCRAHAYHYRGRVYQWYKQDNAKAVADYTEALHLDPDIEMVRYRRAMAFHDLKEYAKANADFSAAHKLDPDYPNLLNAWAWQLATCPDAKCRDGQLALQMAKKTGDMDTLAAAYAETGAFNDAVATQKRAIEQLDREPQPKDQKAAERRKERRMQMQTRLVAYEAKQPYRDK
ncbi:MAG: SUMF1/EgtB/PvdO family nonheme iron enzyme [Thermoguttaceae bacterium]